MRRTAEEWIDVLLAEHGFELRISQMMVLARVIEDAQAEARREALDEAAAAVRVRITQSREPGDMGDCINWHLRDAKAAIERLRDADAEGGGG